MSAVPGERPTCPAVRERAGERKKVERGKQGE